VRRLSEAAPLKDVSTPFMLGVSGHRDLTAGGVADLRDAVARFVDELRQLLPETPLRILVGMADGADLVVAQTAVDLGVSVEALLPMPLKDYAADFDAATFERLQQLLQQPQVRCVELTLPVGSAVAASAMPLRDQLYANLTATLVRRSSLMLAVWDGQGSTLPGGTADTVLRYLGARNDSNAQEKEIEFVAASAEFEAAERLVYWIPAARRSDGAPESAPLGEPCYLMGAGDNLVLQWPSMPAQMRQQLIELNHYNDDARTLASDGRLPPVDSLARELPPGLPPSKQPMLAAIDQEYGKADALARHFQRYSDRLFRVFGFMTFTMGLAYLIYEKVLDSAFLLGVYVSVLLGSTGIYYLYEGRHWFAKHLSYRALAETMRAKYYLHLAGADERVDAAEILALSGIDRFKGFGWVGCVLKSLEPPDAGAASGLRALAEHSQHVEQVWINNQHRYFTARVARLERSNRRTTRLKRIAFVLVLLAIIALFVLNKYVKLADSQLGIPLHNALTFFMGFFAVMLGAWELHQEKMATRELLWQYRNQLSHFTRTRLELEHIRSASRRAEVLAALGKDSLMECYLWTIHRYHREHEPPTAAG
jgi:hypothetical protein